MVGVEVAAGEVGGMFGRMSKECTGRSCFDLRIMGEQLPATSCSRSKTFQ